MSLKIGDRVELEVIDIAFGGEGVARVEDFVVFVFFVLVGERAEVEITEVKKSFARARLQRILLPSPDRVTPRCRYYGDCGGCQYQHIGYSRQLAIKRKQITDLFQRIGGLTVTVVDPVIPCPTPYGYRNRIMIRSQWDKVKQGLNIGFIRIDNRLVVDLESCAIAEPALNEQIRAVRASPPPKGGLKVVLRNAPEGWEVPRDSFFQNNFHLLPELIRVVREAVVASGAAHLIDVYCGVGFFGIELAGFVSSVTGIELDRLAIEAARRNAGRRNLKNTKFLYGQAEELLPSVVENCDARHTTVVLDPPRTGCPPEMLQLLRMVGVQQIIYISCHPATLARDLKTLCENEMYRLVRLVPLDMFPQTQHVECVADLRKINSPV